MPDELTISVDKPDTPEVRRLLHAHLDFARRVTPPGHVHALEVEQLAGDEVTLYSARRADRVVAIGALRRLTAAHVEIKSMHTAEPERGTGVGRAMLSHLIAEARLAGYQRVSLETGTMSAFVAARTLYRAAGFVVCPPFAEHTLNEHSVCMTLAL